MKTENTDQKPAENSTPPLNSASPINASELVSPLAGAMPEPTEHAGESMNSSEPEKKPDEPSPENPAHNILRDKRGVMFRRDKHRCNPQGQPMVDKNGNYYSKNLGAPKGSKTQKQTPAPSSPPPPSNRPPPTFAGQPASSFETGQAIPTAEFSMPQGPDIFEMQADAYLAMSYGPLMAYFSPDVRPDENEHMMLKQTLAAWFRKMKKVPEIHEGVTFGMVAFGVFAGKLRHPTVRDKWELFTVRVKQLWAKWTGKNKREEAAT